MTAAITPIRPAHPTTNSGHPDWCATTDPHDRCGTHLGLPNVIPATAGKWRAGDIGVIYPAVSVTRGQNLDGSAVVEVEVGDPTGERDRWAIVRLTGEQTRALMAALSASLGEEV